MTSRCLKRCRRKLLALAVASCFAAELAHGNPTGPTVVRGQASFAAQGNTLTVTNSPGAVINWQSFSIPSQEITRFLQQSAASAVLNRVTGSTPSSILGQLQSNGRVYLINPNGITIGQGAVIDVAGFVASSLNLSDADFAAGRLRFTETPGAGAVINRGEIKTSSGGMVYLVGQSVENHGVIKTPEGEIVLAAGKSIELVDAGTPEIRVQITAPDNQALNLGQLLASGGRIGMYAGLVRHGGTANANTAVVGENGKIVFKATKSVTLEAGSVTTASGPTAGSITIEAETGTAVVAGMVEANATAGRGGSIEISGQQGVTLESSGRLSANGLDGGTVALSSTAGSVRVAGQINADASAGRGGQIAIAAATQTSIATSARVTANGTQGGGSVSVAGNESVLLETGSSVQANGAAGGVVTVEATQGSVDINGAIEATGGAADGGIIRIAARTGVTLGDSGVLSVLGNHGGEVRVEAWDGTTLVSGFINAFGGDGQGGKVLLLGLRVGLIRNARVNVSGQRGGGEALVGGDFHGDNPDVQNAERTYVGADARITADAIETGDGGKVVVWSDEVTRYYGTISARGGVNGGNGGFAEVSGKEFLVYRGTADLRAPAGSFGTLLLDPRDITIQASGADNNQLNAAVPAGPDPAGSIYFADVNGTTDFTLTAATVSASTSNIVLQAQRDVNVNAAVNITTSGVRFTAQAGRDVKISAALTTNAGQIILEADSPHQPGGMDGVGMVIVNAPVNSCGGAVPALCSGANITLIGGGNSSPQGGFTLNADVNAGTGGINVALSTNTVGLDFFIGAGGNTQLSSNDTGSLKTTGALVLGTAMSAGTNGLGTGAVSLTVQSITNATASPVQLSTESGSSFQLVAGSGGITLSKPLTSFQDMVINTTGPLVISQTISTSNNDLSITASSVTLTGNGSINTGTGTVTCSGGGCGALGTSVFWDGGANTLNWFDAANWSGDAVPDSTKDVTINVTTPISSSTTVLISTGGAALAKSLNALTPVELSSGSLTLANASTFNNSLTLSGGSLTATSFVTVGSPTGALTWSAGSMGGAGGSFILASSQSGTLSNALSLNLPFQNSGTLTLSGATISGTGSINNLGTLTATGTNSVAKMLLSSGSIGGAGALTVDDWSRTGGVFNMTGTANLRVPSGNFTVDQTYSAGSLTLLAPAGDIVLNAAVTGTGASGTTVTLAAGNAFTNNVGAAAIDPGTGRWLVYSTNPSGNTFGGLVSGNKAIWGRSYPTTVGESGNRYVFSDAGSVTITTTDASKTYGQTADVSSNYTLSGTPVTGAATYGNVFGNVGVAEIFSAGPTVSSVGSAPTASVAAGPYSITATGTANSGYSLTFADNGLLTVGKAGLTVTANNASKTYGQTVTFGGTEFISSGLQNSETIGSVTLASGGAAATANVAGSPYAITASAATGGTFATGNYNISYVDGALTVGKAGLTVTANNASKTYGQTVTFGGTEFISSGLQNSETIGSVTLASGGAAATANVAGSPYAITASAATGGTFATGNYNISYVDGALTVGKAGLTVTANNASKTYGQTVTFGGTEFISSGLQNSETIGSVTLASGGAAATANVAGSPYAITASAATGGTFATGNYNISYVDGALTVGKAGLTVTANNASKTYGQTVSFAGTEFISSGLQNSETIGSVTLASGGAAATANVAGSPYAITASAATGGTFATGNYNISYVDGALTVGKAGLTVTANNASKTYGQTVTFGGTEFISSGLQNSETIGTVTLASGGAAATANVAGSPYAITASAATGGTFATGNYNISYVDGALTVGKAGLTVTANNASKTYGQTVTFGGTEFISSGLQNSETIGSVTLASGGAAATANVAGSPYAITASAATGGTFATGNYNISYVDGALTVGKAGLTVTANNASKTYGQTVSFAGTEFISSGLQNSETIGSVTLASGGAAATANVAGSPYAITASAATGGTFATGNYNISYVDGALTVGKAGLTVTANNASKTYGQTVTFGGTEFISSGLQNSETIGTVTLASGGAAATANVAGSPYAITASAATGGTFATGNYNISYVDGALTVGKAGLTVTANNASKTYGQTVTFGGTEFISSGLQNSETIGSVTLASGGAAATANVAGSPYAITASAATGGTFATGNYNISYVDGALTVGKAGLTVTANNASKTYGQTVTFGGTEFISSGLQNSETIGSVTLASGGAAATANVAGSPYAITASAATGGTFATGNYNISYVDGALTVGKAGLTVTANNASKTYGQTVTFGGTEFISSGLQNSETIGSVTLASGGAAATANVAGSPYAITASAATGGTFATGNYNISYVDGALTVGKAGLTVTANNASKTYGQTVSFAGTEFISSGLQNSETIGSVTLASGGAAATANVAGSPYAITASAATGGTFATGNYNISYVDGALTVGKAGLTVTANNASKTYGQTVSFAGTEFISSGLQNSETIGTVTLASGGAAATANVAGSPYAITASAATGGTFATGNYNISYVDGALTVGKAGLTVTANNASKTYGQTVSFAGTEFISSGLQNSETIGTVTLASGGAAATANVAGSPYAITASAATGGTFATGNYNISYVDGALTVNPALINLTLSRTYDGGTNFGSGLVGTLIGVNGETLAGGGGTGTVASPNASVIPQTLSLGGLVLGNGSGLAGNYTLVGGTHTATITPANLTGTIANQTKMYGADDPALAGIVVTLGGAIGSDASNLATTLSNLTRTSGENVASYGITLGTFNALTGSAAGNYNAPTFTGSPVLVITPAPLTAGISNQVKTYGINDPALSTIGVTLGGLVNRTISTWNGTVVLNDAGNVAATLAGLARTGGENVGSYGITGGALNALTGSAAGNYSGPSLNVAGSTLTINPVPLTAGIADQTKTYASNDPAVGTIAVTLGGAVNASVTDWNGNVTAINDTVALAPTLTDLTRVPGENVGSYNITGGTLTLNGAAAANYSGASLNVSGTTLDIVPPPPNAVVNPTVTTWDGPVAVDINFIWTAGASGSWTTGSAWDKGFAPVNGAVVTIPDIGAPGVTNAITYSGGTTNLRSLTSSEALTMAGGTLNLGTTSADVSTIPLVTLSGGVLGGAGTVNVATMNILAGGILNGTGTIIGNVNNTAGTVAPGVSPGILTINGNYVQGPGGTLAVEIGGTAAGTQYDQLVITGNATLDGTLNVALINGFVPASGNSFTVVQGGTVSGAFATTNFPAAQPMTTTYLASNVSVLANASPPLAQLPPSAPAPPLIDQLPGLPESGSGTGLNIVTVVNPDTGQREILDGFVGQNIVTTVNPETGERQILDGVVGQNVVTTVNPLTGEREFVGVTAGDSKSGGKIGVCK